MMAALLYLQVTSTWNRAVARLKRLRQPKYLIGGIVGGIYIYAYFFRHLFSRREQGGADLGSWFTPENRMMIECGAGLVIGLVVVLSWLLPNKRAALTFTEAEIAFLFPAPVARRTLVQFKLLRSQLGILFTVLIFSLVSRRLGGNPLIHALGWWLVLSVLNLHFLGVSFLRTMLLDRGITHWMRRWIILGVIALLFVIAGLWMWRALSSLDPLGTPNEALEHLRLLLTTGPVPVVTFPFRLLVRPYLASTLMEFAAVAWPAFLILLAHYWFVLRADVAFEEASLEASRKLAERVAAARTGRMHGHGGVRPRRSPFNLAAQGPPAMALFWKNLIGAGQFMNKRFLLILTVVMTIFALSATRSGSTGSVAAILGMLALMFLVWSILLGPQILAQDFRQDLKLADLIKTYPMGGRQVVLGELLAPVVILTCIQWLLVPLAVGGVLSMDQEGELSLGLVCGLAIALGILAPAINFLSFVIPNASVLVFPAWFQADKSTPHGIEAMGQRIITLVGQMLILFLSALPAGIVFAIVLLLLKWAVGWWLAAPVAGLAAAAVIALEGSFAVVLMGRWFERLDVSTDSKP